MTGVVKTVRFYERGYWAARMEQRMVEYRQAGGRLE
jgi:hypothetical protein